MQATGELSSQIPSEPSLPNGYTLVEPLTLGQYAPGQSDTFTVQLNTDTPGTFAGDISIPCPTDAYSFGVTGTVTQTVAEVEVDGLGTQNIVCGAAAASATNGTDFGSAFCGAGLDPHLHRAELEHGHRPAPVGHADGPRRLHDHAAASTPSIPPGGSSTFTVQLSTANVGTFAGVISFSNNDSDNGDGVENPFTFYVSGNITALATGYAVRYSLSPLGELDGSNTTANGINDNGQIVGETNETPFLYSDGTVSYVDSSSPPGYISTALGINNRGQIVGYQLSCKTGAEGFVYSDGVTTLIPPVADGNEVEAINNNGLAIGSREVSDGVPDLITYDVDSQTLTDLRYVDAEGMAVNDNGQIAGETDVPVANGFDEHAFLYSNGRLTDLGTFGGYSSATGISEAGQVIGWSAFNASGTTLHAFLYANGQMIDLGTLGGTRSMALGIDNAGIIVGSSSLPNLDQDHAFLYANSTMFDLNDLLDSTATGWLLTGNAHINNLARSSVTP